MSANDDSSSPRIVNLDCTVLVEMPLNLLRERIRAHFKPNTPDGAAMAKILTKLSGVLMSWPRQPENMQRAVDFLEFSEWLDGLGTPTGKRAA